MINFIDEKGIKHSAIVECKKTKGVNGEKSLSGTIYTNEKILEGIGRGWRLEFENEKYCLTYVYPIDEGNRIVVEFDAVHEFFFDLNKKVVYSELNGPNTAKAYLDLIFNGSGYSCLIEVNIPAFEKEGFGMRNRLDLFKEFISDTGVEFSVNGKVVRILEKVGSNLSTIVKKGFNLNELRIEKDPGSFITYKKGFGAWHDDDDHSKGRLEVEYLSPLASIYGKFEGDPIVDERYKVASNFETRLKNEVESSYGISVDIDMEDLTKAGYEYEQPREGDYIMAINKDLGFEQKIRIMSYETSYDTNGNIIDHKVACGSDNIIRKSKKEDDDFRKEIQAGLEGAISTSNKAWVSANGKNAVFEGPDEPAATAIGDTWFQIDGDKKIMRIWNGYEWKPVFNPGEIENKIDQAEKDIAQNIIDIESALDKATQAELDAGFSKDLAGEAKALGVTASSLAGEAATNANKAMTDVNALTGRVTSAEGSITTIEGQVALKANSSDVNTLTGRVTTAEGNITTQGGLIALKANATDVNTLTGRVTATEAKITATDGKVTTLTTKTDGNTTQIGLLQSGYDGLSSTVTELETGKVGNAAFSALEQNLSGFKTTVANTYADKTTVSQLSTQWTTTTNLVNGHTSQIASLGTDINLRATKAELISQINLSPETILIASRKIQIKGDTYIDNGVIKTAHIADLAVNGAKIADATIGSAKITNLDVSKIVGNTTSFVQSYWNAINSRATINGNELRFTHTDGSYTSMRPDGLKRFIGSNGNQYHSLIYLAGYVLGSTTAVRWAQLPNEFKGKPFTAFIVLADSMQAQYNSQSINRMAATGHPNYQIDFTNARIPLIGYKLLTNGTNIVTSDVQGLLIVVY